MSGHTLVLAQCTNTKRDETCRAEDLYSASPYFRAQRAYAETFGDSWAILSAKHHYVEPSAVIGPYDTSMADVDSETWTTVTVDQLAHAVDLPKTTIVLLAGRDYAIPLTNGLADENVGEIREPFDGLRIGVRHHELNERVDAATATTLGEFA